MGWAIFQSLVNGILMGGTYALLAVGTTIIFGVMRMINFASSAFIMLGMYVAWWACNLFHAGVYVTLPFSVLVLAILAYLSFKLAIEKVMFRDAASVIIVTIGLMYVLQNITLMIFGTTPLNIFSDLRMKFYTVLGITTQAIRLISFGTSVLLTVILALVINKTSYGRCMRATSESQEIAQILGVNAKFVFISAWIIGIVLTGIAGTIMSPLYNITIGVGSIFGSTALIAIVLGGMGDIRGAFISGIALGIVEALVSVFVAPELGQSATFILFLVVMRFKPQGLFGRGERVA